MQAALNAAGLNPIVAEAFHDRSEGQAQPRLRTRPGVDAPLTAHWLLSGAVPLVRNPAGLYLNMALQGPFVVVADSPAVDVVAALRAEGAFPIIEVGWADAAAALSSSSPKRSCWPSRAAILFARRLWRKRSPPPAKKNDHAFTPIVARMRDDGAPALPDALAIAINAPVERLNRRLTSLLRIRALHATVLRRTTTLASRGEFPPELPSRDPLDDATVS